MLFVLLFLLILLDQSVTAVAGGILLHGLLECGLVEVGPQRVGEVEFGIGCLPEEEVAQTVLAACAYDQIGVGDAGRVERLREALFGDVVGGDFACGDQPARLDCGRCNAPAPYYFYKDGKLGLPGCR